MTWVNVSRSCYPSAPWPVLPPAVSAAERLWPSAATFSPAFKRPSATRSPPAIVSCLRLRRTICGPPGLLRSRGLQVDAIYGSLATVHATIWRQRAHWITPLASLQPAASSPSTFLAPWHNGSRVAPAWHRKLGSAEGQVEPSGQHSLPGEGLQASHRRPWHRTALPGHHTASPGLHCSLLQSQRGSALVGASPVPRVSSF